MTDRNLGTAAGNSVSSSITSGSALPPNITIQNGNPSSGTTLVIYSGDFTGNLNLLNFANGTMSVGGNFLGNLTATSISSITIGGSLDTGTITVGTINTLYAPHLTAAPNSVVIQITQGGVLRQVQAGVPIAGSSTTNPLAYYSQLPPSVTFAIAYDGSTLTGVPQAAIRVTNPNPTVAADEFELALTSSSTAAKFDLSRLDATGTLAGVDDQHFRGWGFAP